MKKNKQFRLILLLLFLLPLRLLAQEDITGLWKGTLFNDTTKEYLPYEIAISDDNGKLTGYSYTVFKGAKGDETGIKTIRIKRKKDNKIVIEDIDLIDNNYTVVVSKKVRKLMDLTLTVKDSVMVMTGTFKTNYIKEYRPVTGKIEISKKNNFWKEEPLMKKLDEMKLSDNLSFIPPEQKKEHLVDNKPIAVTPVTKNNQDITVTNKRNKKDQQQNIVTKSDDSSSITVVPNVSKKKIKEEHKPTIVTVKDSSTVAIVKNSKKEKRTEKEPNVVSGKDSSEVAVVKQSKKEKKAEKQIVEKEKKEEVKKEEVKSVVVEKKKPVIVKAAVDADKRKTQAIRSVFFKTDSLVFTLYDNGVVDGDTVSVLMNGNIIFSKQGLTERPISKTIYTNGIPDSSMLILYAENLEVSPPNTGLLIIYDGKTRHEIFFSADLSNNAAVILRRKKDG